MSHSALSRASKTQMLAFFSIRSLFLLLSLPSLLCFLLLFFFKWEFEQIESQLFELFSFDSLWVNIIHWVAWSWADVPVLTETVFPLAASHPQAGKAVGALCYLVSLRSYLALPEMLVMTPITCFP